MSTWNSGDHATGHKKNVKNNTNATVYLIFPDFNFSLLWKHAIAYVFQRQERFADRSLLEMEKRVSFLILILIFIVAIV